MTGTPKHAQPPPEPVTPPEGLRPALLRRTPHPPKDPAMAALLAQLDMLEGEIAALRDQLGRMQHP